MRKLTLFSLLVIYANIIYPMSDTDLQFMYEDFSYDWIMRLHNNPDEMTLASLNTLYNLEKHELTDPNKLQITRMVSVDWLIGTGPSEPQPMQVAATTAYALSHTIIGHLIQITDKKVTPEPVLDKIVALCTCRYFGMLNEGMRLYTAEAIADSAQEAPIIAQPEVLSEIIQSYYASEKEEITRSVTEY